MFQGLCLFDNSGITDISDELTFVFRLLLGGVLGFIIGIERSMKQKEAGMATHFTVGLAASLLTCISVSFGGLGGDPARIAAQIVSGIGFLGAGMIFFRRESLHGLTTAAGVWATAAIGMAAGAGMYIVACGATAIEFVVQLVLHTKRFRRQYQRILLVKFYNSDGINAELKEYFGVEKFSRFKMMRQSDGFVIEAVIRPTQNQSADSIARFVQEHEAMISIERLEDL